MSTVTMNATDMNAIDMCASGLLEALYTILAQANPKAAARFACNGWGKGLGLCPSAIEDMSSEDQAEYFDALFHVLQELGYEGISLELAGSPSAERLVRPSEQLAAD